VSEPEAGGAPIPAWVDGALVPYPKLAAHREGLRHMAVSVFVLRDAEGGLETLIQRRAAGKYHTPGLWANSCCTHPAWTAGGPEDDAACAARRLTEELGIQGLEMRPAGTVEYRAEVGGGLMEHEVVRLFTAQAPQGLRIAPNPDEVQDIRWISVHSLLRDAIDRPARYTPWLRIYLTQHAGRIFGHGIAA
jgi:isopentenyl-diphosphate delta-isomerase